MAESYRGLTIRIGGDTTKLTKALHAANQAISGTQSELRKLSTAMRLDPTSFNAAKLQMGAMAEQAANTASKIVTLRQAVQEVGQQKIELADGSATTIAKMVEDTRQIQLNAALMREGFNQADASLRKAYTELSSFSKLMGDLGSEYGSGKFFSVSYDNTDVKSLNEEFDKLRNGLALLKSEIGDEGLKDLGVKMTSEQVQELQERIMRLKKSATEYGDALSNANKGAKFQDLEAETARAEASMTSFIRKLAEANETISMKEATEGIKYGLDSVNSAMDTAQSRLKQIDNALKFDPKNPELLADRMKVVADGTALAKLKVDSLKQVIENFNAKGITDSAKSTSELAASAQKAKQAYIDAEKSLSTWEGEVDRIKQDLIKVNGILDETPNAVNEQGEAYTAVKARLEATYNDAKSKVKEFAQAAKDAATDQQEAFGRLSVREFTEQLHQAEVEAEHFSEVDATPKLDSAAFMQAVNMISQAARRMATEIVQSSNEIDMAYRDMRKTVQGSEAEFEALKKSAIEYSQTHITSADTMLEMQALGGQLGILIDDLEEFGTITSNLDISTNMDAEDIALRLGQVANVLDLDIEGMQGFADALVRLGNNMPTQESNIMNIAQRFAAVATTANFSGSEILAWSAAIASTGQRSEMAATAIGNTVSGIEQAVAQGGSALNNFSAIAQMGADEFVKAWKNDPTEVLKAFIEGLKTLKDSDESAVAALENMGITGVRQQQTLLGLSNTIDNLDDALAMSADAWDQLDDKWGKAGDAAIEAGRKSEGFSGALAILQNNAHDLSQTLGDSLETPMRLAASLLSMMTDSLNAMPASFRAVITLVGGGAVAFGTLAPVLKVFGDNIGNLLRTMGQSTGISTFISNIMTLGGAAEASAAGVSMLSTALVGIGIGAVVIGIMSLVSAFSEWEEHERMLQEATYGLETAMEGMKDGFADYATEAQNASASVEEIAQRSREVTEQQATMAQTMRDEWKELGVSIATVDDLTDKIVTLMEKAEDQKRLDQKQQAELTAAVKAYNEETGASIQVIDAVTGKLDVSTSAIRNNTAAWKEQAEEELRYEHYKEVVKERMEAEEALNEAKEKQSELNDEIARQSKEMEDSYGWADPAYLQPLNDELREVNASIEDLQKDYNSAKYAQDHFFDDMEESTQTTSIMRDALLSAGMSTEEFDSLTKEELDEVVKTWNGTAQGIVDAIERIRSANGNASDITSAMAEKSKETINALYKQRKAEFDAQEKELKRQLDSAYKDKQREYDAEYKAQQREFDREYKAQQKAFDAEYKQAKKAYDDEYSQLKKALDADYKMISNELDKEYKARKKAYDNQLKALKNAQQDEVDAFNKATDNKLKAMEREYKEKLRLLELEYGQRDESLDEEIKRLDAETEAEKKAIERRNENDKKAELQKAVDQAKSRRTRAEAEKALNDYLQELDQKHNEEARKTEQERLKDQQDALKSELQQRKDALKEQYDADVAAYKDKRAAELDALQEANDIEYEARKEQYDLLLEQMKEAQTAELEALKEAHTTELEALKEFQTASLETIKEAQQVELDNLKQWQQDQLDAIKQDQQDKLTTLKDSNQKQLDDQKATNDKKLQLIKDGNLEEAGEQKKHEQETKETAKRTGEHINDGISAGYKKAMGATMESSERMKKSWEQTGVAADSSARKTGDNYNRGLKTGYEKAMGATMDSSERMKKSLGDLSNRAGDYGSSTGSNYARGIHQNIYTARQKTEQVTSAISNLMQSPSYSSGVWGSDFLLNFTNSVVSAWNRYGYYSVFGVAQSLRNLMGFSVPKEGPLHHQDEWGGHFMENLIDGMASKEDELLRHVENMARAIEDTFDPTLSVDAAYEAIDSIGRGRASTMAQAMSESSMQAVEINMSISDVTVRSDDDIDKLANEVSRRIASQVRRQQAGRL